MGEGGLGRPTTPPLELQSHTGTPTDGDCGDYIEPVSTKDTKNVVSGVDTDYGVDGIHIIFTNYDVDGVYIIYTTHFDCFDWDLPTCIIMPVRVETLRVET